MRVLVYIQSTQPQKVSLSISTRSISHLSLGRAECRRHHVFTPRRFQFPGRAVISRSRGCGSHTHIVCLLPPRESQKQILLLSRDCRWANKWIPEEHIRRRDLTWAKQQRRADRDGCCGYLRWHPKIEDPQRPATILSRLSHTQQSVNTRELYSETSRTRKHRPRYKWRDAFYIIEQHMPWGWMTDWLTLGHQTCCLITTHAIPIQAQSAFVLFRLIL